jgi:2'-5' RNA ligase
MSSSRYALVAYIRQPVGEFVENLRGELHPVTAHMAAHLTILPPRQLRGTEADVLEFLEEACSRVVPFDVELGEVATFLPTTPTVFIEIAGSARRMCELHDQLCADGLLCHEEWPYVPHLTIVKADKDDEARAADRVARERWAKFTGPRLIHVEELMFVREEGGVWRDVAPIPLGRTLLSARP